LLKKLRHLAVTICVVAPLAACGPAQTRVDPDASQKRYLLGADYFNKGLVQPAMEELLKAVELDPNNPDAHNLLGLVWLRKAAEQEELSTRNQCLKGESLALEKGEADTLFKKAEAQFDKAIQLKQDFSEARNNLAVVMLHFGRYEEAVQLEEKALSNIVYREPYVANGNLGQAYFEKGDMVRAAKALRQALFEQPKFCVGRYRLAKVYYEQKDWDHAAEEIDQVTNDKACPIQEAYHLAGMVALRRDNRDKAREMFARCVELAPKSCLASECKLAQ
jgi:type IV pilus assembly protein PilF